jgi:hypothetical protein
MNFCDKNDLCPDFFLFSKTSGGTGFQPVLAQAKPSWPFYGITKDEKCRTAALVCFF